ncbi:DNA-binding protein [Thiolapillus sp.]|uniref:DNA-binding protein n=1 Tax=Thiolapillus sp. TaxID=2017437 RepID=UPI003AF7F9BB
MKTSKPKNTREKVRAAAWQLIEEGISPSRTKIRDRIGPGGSDATVADELHCFWTELGEHVKQSKARPDIPVEFMAPQQNLWVAEVGLRQMIRSVLSG